MSLNFAMGSLYINALIFSLFCFVNVKGDVIQPTLSFCGHLLILGGVDGEEENPALEDGGDSGNESPRKMDESQVPYDMRHLPTEYMLVQHFIESFRLTPKSREDGYWSGAIHIGLPCDPSKKSTLGYLLKGLPNPDLGVLPRDEIIKELRSDNVKDCKQRRDVDFPCLEKETQHQF